MARLLLVEIRRATARGVTRLLTLAGVLVIVLAGVLMFIFVPDADEVRAEAREFYERAMAYCTTGTPVVEFGPGPGQAREREVAPGQGRTAQSQPDRRETCDRMLAPERDRLAAQRFRLSMLWPDDAPPPDTRGDEDEAVFLDLMFLFNGFLFMPAVVLLIGGFAGGASMVGGEWQAGTFQTLLTWEPRRARLLVARLAAAALVGLAIAVALFALFTGALLPTVLTRGEMPVGDWWVTYAGTVMRFSGLVALAAAAGGAVAMIGKRTVFTLLALFGYLIGGEIILRQLWADARPWLLLRNMALAVGAGDWLGSTAWRGIAVLLAFAGVAIVAALVAFGRRDFATTS